MLIDSDSITGLSLFGQLKALIKMHYFTVMIGTMSAYGAI